MEKGTEKLGKLLVNQMNSVSGYVSGTPVMLGEITSGLGLKLDNVSYTIPKGDYMVCRSAMLPDVEVKIGSAEGHTHSATITKCFRPIKSGDRVLIVMIGSEYIVIDIVLSSDSTFKG